MSKYLGETFRIPYPKSKAGSKNWSKQYGVNAPTTPGNIGASESVMRSSGT